MGASTSEVGYTSAITRRGGGPQNLYGHMVALGEKKIKLLKLNMFHTSHDYHNETSRRGKVFCVMFLVNKLHIASDIRSAV
jgi:hypothetical protein